MKIDRRSALAFLGTGAALPAAARGDAAASPAVDFRHGVASGDPASDGAILWTRATPADPAHARDVPLTWHVATGAEGAAVASGRAKARAAKDFTVKVTPKGLQPGTEHWFWFEAADGTRSRTGRFRTLPAGATPDVVLAVVSCQLYSGGFFNAYDAIARLDRLDAVVHLGDYIYEYAAKDYGRETAAKLGRIPDPDHEMVTLADYRRRHAHYKLDPDLQAAHARAAFIVVWDDHETTNDSWRDGAENHQPETEGDWKTRKAAALQAYFEWMPIRDPIPGKPWDAINRSFAFGDLADLMMVETRLLARDRQIEYKGDAPSPAEYATTLAEVRRADREMLGEPQLRWLAAELKASVAAKRPWQVIGNQVVMARVAGPDYDKLVGPERFAELLATLPEGYRERIRRSLAAYRAGIPMNLDAWDGYPAARERLYDSFKQARARPIVLAGDSHAFWGNNLHDADGRLVGVEFGTSSITSPSVGDAVPQLGIGEAIERTNEEVVFCDQQSKGFILLTLTPEAARGDYVAVSTILARDFTTSTVARFEAPPQLEGALRRLA